MNKFIFAQLKELLTGYWEGEGIALQPEQPINCRVSWNFKPDPFKEAIFYEQKTRSVDQDKKKDDTICWDSGFIVFRDESIVLVSALVSGSMESYDLSESTPKSFLFSSSLFINDSRTIRSQRLFQIDNEQLNIEINKQTSNSGFQNHLKATLKKSTAEQV